MGKRPERPSEPLKLTPPPKYTSDALGKAIIETGTAVKFMREDMLPPLVKDTKEARDKAREALQKVDGHLVDNDSHSHPCVEGQRQGRQDDDIGMLKGDNIENKTKVGNTAKLVWWLMSIAVGLALTAGGFTWATRLSTAENSTTIVDIEEDIDEAEVEIRALQKAQQADRELYLREVRALPGAVTTAAKQVPPTVEEIEDAADDLPLTEREHQMLLRIMKTAKQRGNGKAASNDGR